MKIRKMDPGDAQAVRNLICKYLLKTDPTSPDEDAQVDLIGIDAALARTDPAMLWNVAVVEDELVGCCMIAQSHFADDVWEIGNLTVTKKYRRQGIGSGLIIECEEYAHFHDGKLILLASDKPKIYRKLGYKEIRGGRGTMRKRL